MANNLAIPPQRALFIVNEAVRIIHHHCELLDIDPSDLLPKTGQSLNTKLKDLADNVVLMEQNSDWDTQKYPDRYTAGTLPLFQPLDVKRVFRDHLEGYGSWLYRGEYRGTYSVVFDSESINAACVQHRKPVEDVIFKLFLHELGHFVLHRKELFKGIEDGCGGTNADAENELEAWLFAYTVIGICIGDRAYQTKILGSPDQSFLHL